MRNEFFHAEDAYQKRRKMRDIIRHRIKDIQPDHLEALLDAIDYERQYYVKIMRNPQKFKNIVVNEHVQQEDENFHSESYRVYGEFVSGTYKRTQSEVLSESSSLNEDAPAAAIKHTKIVTSQAVRSMHEIVIYQPQKAV